MFYDFFCKSLDNRNSNAISKLMVCLFLRDNDSKFRVGGIIILIVCTLRPKWVVLPGTEGCAGYGDYFFHFKGFLIGCVYTAIMALIIAGIDWAVLRFLMG